MTFQKDRIFEAVFTMMRNSEVREPHPSEMPGVIYYA